MAIDPLLLPLLMDFATEARELCALVAKDLLELEHLSPDQARPVWNQMGRHLHTLKGSGAMMEQVGFAAIAHALETVAAPLANSSTQPTRQALDPLFLGIDYLEKLLANIEAGQVEQPAEIEAFVASLPTQPAAGGGQATVSQPVREAAVAKPEPSGELTSSWRIDSKQVSGLSRDVERLREVRLRLEERRREVERAIAALDRRQGAASAATLLVLQGLSGALQIDGEETEAITHDLEESVKAIANLPLHTLLTPLQRAVRDLGAQLGKDVRLSMVGGELSVDRLVLEALRGPLMHTVRNAVDHGLERPHVRERAGKDRTGALVIRGEQQGNILFLEVSDDGAGLNLSRIREAAVEKALLPAGTLATMKDAEIAQLIFLPSFSTRTEVSEVSGRGVGLDVVASQVRAMKGQVEVTSVAGQGTRFTFHLPISHGSSPVTLVACGGQYFGIPSLCVETMLLCRPENLHVSHERFDLEYRDGLIPFDDLGAVLSLRQPLRPMKGAPVLVVHGQRGRHAYLVDEILGERDLIIRPLPAEFGQLAPYQGVVMLWRGDLAPVLRPEWLADPETARVAVSAVVRVLVVDDAITTRAVQRLILEAGGFQVSVAVNGEQALAVLGNSTFQVIISDIAMAPMDGIALTEELRRRPETREVPVILVSAHDSEQDRQRGFAAGANAFLAKKDCASVQLLAAVNTVLTARKRAR